MKTMELTNHNSKIRSIVWKLLSTATTTNLQKFYCLSVLGVQTRDALVLIFVSRTRLWLHTSALLSTTRTVDGGTWKLKMLCGGINIFTPHFVASWFSICLLRSLFACFVLFLGDLGDCYYTFVAVLALICLLGSYICLCASYMYLFWFIFLSFGFSFLLPFKSQVWTTAPYCFCVLVVFRGRKQIM